jgi:hypothetical protein
MARRLDSRLVFITSAGLARFDEASQHFFPDTTFGVAYANGSRRVMNIAEDRQGNVWIGSDRIDFFARQPDGTFKPKASPLLRLKEVAISMLGNIECRFDFGEVELSERADLEFKRNLYLIYKECLQNVVKHARATVVDIRLAEEGDRLCLSISDNGVGFDETNIKLGNGLRNMHNRATRIGGTMEIHSKLQQGTTLKLTVKIP